MLKDSHAGYGLITIALHWSCAFLIIILFGLGIYMTGLDYYSTWYYKGPALHISLGFILSVLMITFVLWRIGNGNPGPLANHSRSIVLFALLVKYTMYIFIFIVLVSGYLLATAAGKPASLFGIIHIPSIAQLDSINVDRVGLVHELFAWAVVILAALHAFAALAHHFVGHDRTLVRMLKPIDNSSD